MRRTLVSRSRITVSLTLVALWFALAGCEGEGGQASGADVGPQLRTRTATVVLAPEEGLVFATGAHLVGAEANVRSADLLAFAHSGGLKLEPGSPDGAMVVPRKGGRPQVFDSLAELPSDPPAAGTHDLLITPEVGHGCVVLGNVTNGHARVRVTDMDESGALPRVTIEYEASWYE